MRKSYTQAPEDRLRIESIETDELWHAIIEAVDRVWSPPCPQKVLEIGCGSGRFLQWLDRSGHYVQGVEASRTLLRKARMRLPERIVLWEAFPESLPFEAKSFDTVFFVLSLEYTADVTKATREAFRVARSSVIVVYFNAYSPSYWFTKLSGWLMKNPAMVNCRTISPGSLAAMMKSAAGIPLRVSHEPVRWRDMGVGAIVLAPVIVTRFDLAHQIIRPLPVSTATPRRHFVPSPSSFGKLRANM
ncbi:MAG: class I SAM-dependent methyltransferase [Thermodesulforhabdaceae bacterium]